ncbi:hypothetical protein [Zymobacter sp. IVIA_12111.31 C1]|uniref:hypothetical protein n=1 Tax=Zymobacter sp. IVIA_12111.31 C1 TaxID=3394854 RepID=UPI0039C279DA
MYFSNEFGDVINKIEEINGSKELTSLNNFDSECEDLHEAVSKLHYELAELKELIHIFEINNANNSDNANLEFEQDEINSEFSKLISKIEEFKHLNFDNTALKVKQESASEDEDYFEYKYKTINDILELLG